MTRQRPTYTIQCGDESCIFTLKPTTIRVREQVQEAMNKQVEEIRSKAADLLSSSPEDMSREDLEKIRLAEFDQYKIDFALFCMLTDGPHEKISVEDFDVKLTEMAKSDFQPESSKMARRLLSY